MDVKLHFAAGAGVRLLISTSRAKIYIYIFFAKQKKLALTVIILAFLYGNYTSCAELLSAHSMIRMTSYTLRKEQNVVVYCYKKINNRVG